jgi:hypothetical protein
MGAPTDLTTLFAVKTSLRVNSAADDTLLSSLISQISQAICAYLNRPFFLPKTVTENYDGRGGDALMLANWPVNSVSAVSVNGSVIPQAPTPGPGVYPSSGWMLDGDATLPPGAMQRIFLSGYCFTRGRRNVQVTYSAGYQISAESQVIPSAAPYQITAIQPYGEWATDQGVTCAGAALTAVASAPAAGQYSVDPTTGIYTFAAADAGKTVLPTYGYVPAQLAKAAGDWVADCYKYLDRIGQTSKSLGGQETTAFKIVDMPAGVRLLLQNFNCIISV